MGDGCNLECVKKVKPRVHEFVGPVKIVLIDPPRNEYCKKMWGAALVAMAIFLMGMTSMTIVFYTLGFAQKLETNLHIFMCTVGYQIFIPIGILNLNPLSGPAMVMKITDRKVEHMVIQLVGVLFAFVGSAAVMFKNGFMKFFTSSDLLTPHCIAGMLAADFMFVGVIFGPLALIFNNNIAIVKCIKVTHVACGVLAFVTSSVCFILGLLKPSLEVWYDPVPSLLYFSIVFCIFYTLVIIYTPIVKWAKSDDGL